MPKFGFWILKLICHLDFSIWIFLIKNLSLSERIFIAAGIATLLTAPFLAMGGFYLWLAVKIIYLLGVVSLFVKKQD